MKRLSIAIAVYNEERYLNQCLSSVEDIADEIVVVDGGSNDRTVEIAKKYKAKIIETNNPPIFHINKQKALDLCTAPWILQMDADEIVTPVLRQEITERIETDSDSFAGFFIPRKNNFWGHFMKKSGVYPDYVIRLVRNGKAKFPCKSVHEQIEIDGKIGYLSNALLHYSYETMGDYWRKARAYTSLTADNLLRKKVRKNPGNLFRYFIVYPLKTFFVLFVQSKGFMDGIYGLIFSLFSAWHHPIAYWKYLRGIDQQ